MTKIMVYTNSVEIGVYILFYESLKLLIHEYIDASNKMPLRRRFHGL